MIKKGFWLILLSSFLSAIIAVFCFAYLVNGQIVDLNSEVSSLKDVINRYGLSDEVNSSSVEGNLSENLDLTVNQIKNAKYSLETGLSQTIDFRLTNGEYVFDQGGSSYQVYIDLTEGEKHQGVDYLIDDFDGDNIKEALVILKYSAGETAVNKYLAYLDNDNGSAKFVDSKALIDGDLRSIGYKDGIIIIGVVGYGENDPQCCPDEEKTLNYSIVGNEIKYLNK